MLWVKNMTNPLIKYVNITMIKMIDPKIEDLDDYGLVFGTGKKANKSTFEYHFDYNCSCSVLYYNN